VDIVMMVIVQKVHVSSILMMLFHYRRSIKRVNYREVTHPKNSTKDAPSSVDEGLDDSGQYTRRAVGVGQRSQLVGVGGSFLIG